uniref:Helicase-associated domain-containing protein n=2 Tax=Auxenochlorella protothecoides TaxID=3075 RepID=A0A1D1ZVF6_AUXPR
MAGCFTPRVGGVRHSAFCSALHSRYSSKTRYNSACRAGQGAGELHSRTSTFAAVLDRFWQGQGIVHGSDRSRLLALASDLVDEADASLDLDAPGFNRALPGADLLWNLQARRQEVLDLTARLRALHALLGAGSHPGVDVGRLAAREPRLLTEDLRRVRQRLLNMRLAAPAADVLAAAAAQPVLLVEGGEDWAGTDAARAASGWGHGVPADSDWARRCAELEAYAVRHGDVLCGSRPQDDPGLARWAGLQRSAAAALDAAARRQLDDTGFEWDAARAEWRGWLARLRARGLGGGQDADADAFLLTNWCSVQRIARRCGALTPEQVAELDAVGFAWDVPDPLS